MNRAVELRPRVRPKQERARQTIDHILLVTAELLPVVGVDSFNTNLLAKTAGLSPRAIYRYFPNKWAVLRALAEQYWRHEREWIGDLTLMASAEDWRKFICDTIDGYYRAARCEPGFAALRVASRASPELREFEDEQNAEVEQQLALGLRGLGIRLDDEALRIFCVVMMEALNRILDVCLGSPPREADAMLDHIKTMIVSAISGHLEDSA